MHRIIIPVFFFAGTKRKYLTDYIAFLAGKFNFETTSTKTTAIPQKLITIYRCQELETP